MKKLIFIAIMLTALVALSVSSYAATTTSNLNVSANVVSACTVTTSSVNFGDTDLSNTSYANGDVSVNCPEGTAYNIALDAGLHLITSPFLYRTVQDSGGSQVWYLLWKDNGSQQEWGDSDFANTYADGSSLADTGSGAIQPHTVYGQLIGSSCTTCAAGTYTDVVKVTVHY
jgi:spore coat protein U-like protein